MRSALLLLLLLAAAPAATAGVLLQTEPERPGPGELFWVRVQGLEPKGAPEVRLAGRTFALWPSGSGGWEGLAALNRDEVPGVREAVLVDVLERGELLAGLAEVKLDPREYGVQELKVDEAMVTLSPADQERAERENALIREVLAGRTGQKLWTPPVVVPAPGEVSGPFGVRRVYNGKPKSYHNGVDIAASAGTPVTASSAGRVALVGDYFYTGNTVLVDHGLGLFTAYFHLASAAVVEGEPVEPGTILGLVGSTGRSTGPHLHWGVYLSGVRADPLSFLARAGAGPSAAAPAAQPPPAAAGN